MRRIPSTINRNALREEAERVAVYRIEDGSGHHSPGSEVGWIQKFSNARLFGERYDNLLHLYPHIDEAIQELYGATGHDELTQVMVNIIHPGGKLGKHRDGLPNAYRYHLPIVTNRSVEWWDEIEGHRYMAPGYWHGPVNFCGVLHSVNNASGYDRIHLVADFARP